MQQDVNAIAEPTMNVTIVFSPFIANVVLCGLLSACQLPRMYRKVSNTTIPPIMQIPVTIVFLLSF